MMAKLTAAELDRATCSAEDCSADHTNGLIIHSTCHTGAPSWVRYSAGVMTISCAVCGAFICEVAVQRAQP